MDNPYQHSRSLYLVLICFLITVLYGCEDPGAVGTGLGGTESEVISDTLNVTGIQVINPNSYSGELQYFSAGQFDDPLFGNLMAEGYFKPNLPASSDTMHADATMLMQLMYNPRQVYGDTMSTQDFDIYEIDELWRDRALTIGDKLQLSGQKIGEFSVGLDDSMTINMSQIAPQWVEEYREYADAALDTSNTTADSTYLYEEHGLALVPSNSAKIIPLYRDSTRFVIQNHEADTFDVSLNQWGYFLDRGSSTLPEDTAPIHSTFESIINFKDLGGIQDLDLQTPGLSRAELVFHTNAPAMESLPAGVGRPEAITIDLHLAEPEEIPENIDPGVEEGVFRVQGRYSEESDTYRFDITNMVDRVIRSGLPEGYEFFVTFPNDGIVKSTLIYTDGEGVSEALEPKVIITSLKNSTN